MAEGGMAARAGEGAGTDGPVEVPVSALAMALADRLARKDQNGGPVLVVAATERRAERLASILSALLPHRAVHHLPRWDCLPDEPVPPARDITGRRVAALVAAADPARLVLVASPGALLIRVAPVEALVAESRTLADGDPIDLADLETWFRSTGWVLDERVDEPGEAAIRGKVVDVCPADGRAVRIEHEDGRVLALHDYDPASQRTNGERRSLTLLPACEAIEPRDEPTADPTTTPDEANADAPPHPAAPPATDPVTTPAPRPRDIDHRLCTLPAGCDSIFAVLAPAAVVYEPAADAAFATLFADAPEAPRYPHLRIAPDDWAAVRDRPTSEPLAPAVRPAPLFAAERSPGAALKRAADAVLADGGRVLVATRDPRHLDAFRRALGRPIPDLDDVTRLSDASPGTVARLPVDLDGGFVTDDRMVLAAADLLGRRARPRAAAARPLPAAFAPSDGDLAIGDTVVHRDHGLAVLSGLETVETAGEPADMLRLDFAAGAHRLVPVSEIGRVWRYGADPDEVTLDRLDGSSWKARCAKVEAAIRATVAGLAEAAQRRAGAKAPHIRPPRAPFERFVARFAFQESDDQAAAIDAVLADLAAGRPMDRLVCGDVGYGKTEVALRAAAAVALSGRQVAIVAPTTLLARQHEAVLRRRFAGFGIEIAALSRLVKPAAAKAVRAGLADGSVRVVVGTHAIAGKGVAFADLGLMVIDEEQRFGAAHKRRLHALAEGRHVLSLSATPIPRTLQSALAGLQDLSVIATPPVARRPIRTVVLDEDGPALRDALLRERARGGQSFLVCPRIEDIDPVVERFAALAPDLRFRVVHGGLPAEEADRLLLAFGEGDGDVLVATTIIESGLDMPGVNTMVVIHADRFGLAQLHQLRGRVGRGRRRGTVYLTTPPSAEITAAARKRLATVAALDQLGAGFDIAARDLEQRGAGDLLGEEQAGHVKLIGAGFYHHLLEVALATVQGRPPPADPPVVVIGQPGRIPPDLVPEPDVRIGLYARLASLTDATEADEFLAEFADRFGDPAGDLSALIEAARVGALARAAAVRRVDAGPAGIAFAFATEAEATAAAGLVGGEAKGARVVVAGTFSTLSDRAAAACTLLETIAAGHQPAVA